MSNYATLVPAPIRYPPEELDRGSKPAPFRAYLIVLIYFSVAYPIHDRHAKSTQSRESLLRHRVLTTDGIGATARRRRHKFKKIA